MSRGLKALKRLTMLGFVRTPQSVKEDEETVEKELKALEIIKNKRVDVSWIYMCFNFIEGCSIEDELEYYNLNYASFRKSKFLTLEEFILLKEQLYE